VLVTGGLDGIGFAIAQAASMTVHPASGEPAWMSGAILAVDGGYAAG